MMMAQTADREFKESAEFKRYIGWGVTSYQQYAKIKEILDE